METTSVLNTIAASSADITLVARKLNVAITSITGSGQFPTLDYPNIISATVSPSITETLHVTRVGFTFANNTVYSFTINQVVDGQVISKFVTYTSDATATNTEISTALAASFANTALKVTVTGGAVAYVTVTALAGYPTFQVVLGSTGTMTDTPQMAGVQATATTVTAAGVPSIITSVGHGLVNGNVIDVVFTTPANFPSGKFVVQWLSADTYSLYTLSGNVQRGLTATAGVSTTLNKVASASVGNGTVLAAAGIAGAAAGAGYAKYVFNYNVPLSGAPGGSSVNTGNTTTLYVKQWATDTSAAYITNFPVFSIKVNTLLSNMSATGTVAVPTLLVDSLAVNSVAIAVA